MSSILDNVSRNGNFTSSKIANLLKSEKTALTYINEKRWERKLKRSISTEAETRPILWGRFLETWVHEMLPPTYEHVNDITLDHPKYPFWKGSPDFKQNYMPEIIGGKNFIFPRRMKVVSDLKCPQPKAFCQLVDNCFEAVVNDNINVFKDNHEDYYWQLVSNGIITDSDYMELIVYMPFEKDLQGIRNMAENFDGLDQYKYRWIVESSKNHLAYLPDDSDYKDLNIFRFKIPIEDKLKLEGIVVKAGNLLEI
jgi:hypothetical protein